MKTVLHSVSYAGFWGQFRMPLEELIPHTAALGYQGISIVAKRPHASVLDMTPERIAGVKKLLADSKIECASLAAYTDFAGAAPGIPLNEMQVAYIESCAKLAHAWGSRIVRVFTAYEHGAPDLKVVWGATVAGLRECADRIAPLGVSLAVQNHHDLAVAPEAFAELLAEVGRPNCEAGFDAWSPALQGMSGDALYAVAKKMAPLTIQTTCADYIRLPRYQYRPEFTNYVRAEPDLVMAVPFGDGFIDYASFFRGLRDGGFDGWVLYEMCERLRGGGGLENLDCCARQFVEVMKQRFMA